MGIPVLIEGHSGSGKSTSMRNFDVSEVGIFNVASKPLPFRKALKRVDKATYATIMQSLSNPKLKTYVIDDSSYLLAFEMFNRAKENGYGKFTDMAVNFYNLIQFVIQRTPDDVIVYFLHHTQEDVNGKVKAKTVGKMLDDQLTVEGLFSIVLMAEVESGEYYFRTRNSGYDTVKTPMGMFEAERIPNDLKMVDDTIREYWGLNKTGNKTKKTKEEVNE